MRVLYLQKDAFVNPGITALAAYCEQRGHHSDVLIEDAEYDLKRAIRRIEPDVIAFSVTSGLHLWALAMAARVKAWFPRVVSVFGGIHPTLYPELVECFPVDVVCRGDGEEALAELLDALEVGADYRSIPSLWVKESDGTVHRNPIRPLEQDLDRFPFPDRGVYRRYPFVVQQGIGAFVTGRGCPDNCAFCFHVALKKVTKGLGRYARRKSVDYLIAEIEQAIQRYPLRRLVFRDDTFVVDYEGYARPLLERYRERIGLPFSCLVRADYMSERSIRDLAASGCFAVKIGVESGNERVRNSILHKRLSNSALAATVELFHSYGIRVQTSNVVGSPGETLEAAFETLDFNIKLAPQSAWCSLIQPYPGTQLQDLVMREGMFPPDFDVDEFEQSYFMQAPVDVENKDAFSNLQKLFPLAVRFPQARPLIRRAVSLPPNRLFNFLFRAHHAYSLVELGEFELRDFLRVGLHTGRYLRQTAF